MLGCAYKAKRRFTTIFFFSAIGGSVPFLAKRMFASRFKHHASNSSGLTQRRLPKQAFFPMQQSQQSDGKHLKTESARAL